MSKSNVELTDASGCAIAPLVRQPLTALAAAELAVKLPALSDPVRLRLLSVVASPAGGEACVCELSVGLDLMFGLSSSFGATYGPLAGVVALMFWALAASVSFLYGAALSAQLEAVRAGATPPQDVAKAHEAQPAALTAR